MGISLRPCISSRGSFPSRYSGCNPYSTQEDEILTRDGRRLPLIPHTRSYSIHRVPRGSLSKLAAPAQKDRVQQAQVRRRCRHATSPPGPMAEDDVDFEASIARMPSSTLFSEENNPSRLSLVMSGCGPTAFALQQSSETLRNNDPCDETDYLKACAKDVPDW